MQKEQIEEWKPAVLIKLNGEVINFTGLYEASSFGRVRSLRFKKTRILKIGTYTCHDGNIRHIVTLTTKDGVRCTMNVHRLILSSFCADAWRPGVIVNHKVERTPFVCDNSLANLEWIEQGDNISTEHCKAKRSERTRNHPALSKRVSVKDLTTGSVTVYPSAIGAGRALGIGPTVPSACINLYGGYYKKGNLMFSYI